MPDRDKPRLMRNNMNEPASVPKHFLFPGTIAVHAQEHEVTTVLGSCIAVCLWDSAAGVGGINHFMLPEWPGDGTPTARYGNIAIERLLNRLLALDCRKENIVAKVFGGANLLRNERETATVGDRNIILAEDLLRRLDIPVLTADVGGHCGRKVIFNTRTGVVLVAKRIRKRG